jgi:hypothetical protein
LISDTEGFPGKQDTDLVALARDADLIVYDATFTEQEIASRQDWGHPTGSAGFAWPMRPAPSSYACFIMIPRTTTISWISCLPKPAKRGPARSRRVKVRSSISEQVGFPFLQFDYGIRRGGVPQSGINRSLSVTYRGAGGPTHSEGEA